MPDKLQISWDDLSSEKVDKKLAEQDAVAGTAAHYEQTNVTVPQAARRFGFFNNAIVYLTLFGALGGLLGWGFGEVLNFRPDQQRQAAALIRDYDDVVRNAKKIQASDEDIAAKTRRLRERGASNPYFTIYIDDKLTDEQKATATGKQLEQDQAKSFVARLLFYGVSGVTIAMLLAMADSIIDRNLNGAIIYGSIGAVIGLAGGLVVALIVNRVQADVGLTEQIQSTQERLTTQVICWGVLGLFLAAAPGISLRNGKRLLIGMLGGLIGGVIGGLAYVPMQDYTGNEHLSRLIAIVLIGGIAGLACGIIENVVKTGWLKVESGLIAGKQFVLYRNPTFIGAHPMSHIYLFNDAQVGRRHACVHIVGNAYEIENLPLGTPTYVNGQPVARQRLRPGDEVQVGRTKFHFQERAKSI